MLFNEKNEQIIIFLADKYDIILS